MLKGRALKVGEIEGGKPSMLEELLKRRANKVRGIEGTSP